MRVGVLDYHFSKYKKKKEMENGGFSPRLIITFFEQKALRCLVGVTGTPAGFDKSRVRLSL